MPQNITRGIKALIDEANAEIETLSAKDAIEISKNGDVVIVDERGTSGGELAGVPAYADAQRLFRELT